MSAQIVEQAVLLGRRKSLVGILTSSVAARTVALPLVIILNAGIIHRPGPNRMSVALARVLASNGCTSLRFDLSGIGDSAPPADDMPVFDANLADIKDAVDWAESTRQARRVVLVGLCSGADQAAVYSGTDPRVVGAVLIDPSVPRTFGYYWRHYARRSIRLRSWLNLLTGRPFKRPTSESTQLAEARLQEQETREFLERAYRATVEQDVQLLAVFTAGVETLHNYREQLLDAFPAVRFDKNLRLEYFGQADHTFESESERMRLIQLIGEWTTQTNFARQAEAGRPAAIASKA